MCIYFVTSYASSKFIPVKSYIFRFFNSKRFSFQSIFTSFLFSEKRSQKLLDFVFVWSANYSP